MTKLNICQIVPYISNEISGPSYSVPSLSIGIKNLHHNIVLKTLYKNKKTMNWPLEIIQHKSNIFFKRIGWSNEENKWYKKNVKNYDIFHTNGLWMFPNVTPIKLAYKYGRKSVLSPRGTMSNEALKFSKIKKLIFYILFQRSILKKVDLIHVTSFKELKEVRDFGLTQPVTIIPNGIDIHKIKYKKDHKIFKLIYLGRIHPKKGIENAIKAWSAVANYFPNWVFEIAGQGEKRYEKKIQNIISKSNSKTVKFVGPIYGKEKIKFIQTADVLIMPSYNENFGMVAAEALSNNTPVICGKNTPWSDVTKVNCGWHIPNDFKSIEETFLDVFSRSKTDLLKKGKNGRLWMKKDFSWNEIAKKMIVSYEWLLSNKNKPDWIHL